MKIKLVRLSLVAMAASLIPLTASAQNEADIPRTADGNPDLSGIWQVLNRANDNVLAHSASDGVPAGLGVVVGDEIPYRPEALQQREANFANRATLDTEANCYLPGVPRITYMPFPFQIIQLPDVTTFLYEYAHATRYVYTDGSEHPEGPINWWMGDSRGHWEDDTLVIEVTDLNDRTWFDRAGNFHSDALRVVERYTPMSPYHLMYEATIEDANVFTRPWTIRMPLYRRIETGKQLFEYKCVEYVEQLMYGDLGVVDPETGERND